MTQDHETTAVIYLVDCAEAPGIVKIGTTSTPMRRRLQALQCNSPVTLYVIQTFPGARALEGALHGHFTATGRHSHGEWFRLGPDPVRLTLEALHLIEESEKRRANHALAEAARRARAVPLVLRPVGAPPRPRPVPPQRSRSHAHSIEVASYYAASPVCRDAESETFPSGGTAAPQQRKPVSSRWAGM
ncbi:GIY-YIG nuclease family protein [Streptomyces uncialis]|uniref:GIY-YIG nuclease family protein n=1 Tax=Streptomyces uncialis TaxID=1048205 RepID=UPI00382E96D1